MYGLVFHSQRLLSVSRSAGSPSIDATRAACLLTDRGILRSFCTQPLNRRASLLKQSYSPSIHQILHCPTTSHLATMAPHRVPIDAQSVDAPLTSAATFLVLSLNKSSADNISTARSAVASVADLIKNIAVRDLDAQFACTVGIGSNVWDEITQKPRPRELHPFKEIKGKTHTAPSTPGDFLFHIRSERRDLNFEFERQLMEQFGDSVSVVDETVGFRYFDTRDLLGFVDGTANPVGPAVPECTLITAEDDPNAEGGSYVVIQKYIHDLKGWKGLANETQESIVGRTKLENVELDDAPPGKQLAHKSLATVQDDQGNEHDILRDNMPFGSPAEGRFGTYFIGYSRRLWVTEKMLERMFIGVPAGLHDRILDYSTATTGSTFFAPSAAMLASIDPD